MLDEKEESRERPESKMAAVKPDVSPQPAMKTQRRIYAKPFDKASIMVSQINPVDQSASFAEQSPYKPDLTEKTEKQSTDFGECIARIQTLNSRLKSRKISFNAS